MIFGYEDLGVEIPFGSVGGGMFAQPPDLRQGELVVPVDDRRDGLIQLVFGDVSLVYEGHLPPVEVTYRSRRLCRAEVESIAARGHKIPLGGIGGVSVRAWERSQGRWPGQRVL